MTNLEFFKIVIIEIFAMSHHGGETSVEWLINSYESLEILLCFRKSLTKDDFRDLKFAREKLKIEIFEEKLWCALQKIWSENGLSTMSLW